MKITLVERFARGVDKTPGHGPNGDCWRWMGRPDRDGYGQIKVGKRNKRAHRVAYELQYGPISAGLFICHACDTRGCVNPAHLWPGTNADNMQDMVAKGRGANAQKKMTRCKNGHLLGGEHGYPNAKTRQCRTCHKVQAKAAYLAKKPRPSL